MSSDREWKSLTLKAAGISLIDCDHRTPPAAVDGYPYIGKVCKSQPSDGLI